MTKKRLTIDDCVSIDTLQFAGFPIEYIHKYMDKPDLIIEGKPYYENSRAEKAQNRMYDYFEKAGKKLPIVHGVTIGSGHFFGNTTVAALQSAFESELDEKKKEKLARQIDIMKENPNLSPPVSQFHLSPTRENKEKNND